MTTETKSALTDRIKTLLESYVSSGLLALGDGDLIKTVLNDLILEDDTELYSVLETMLNSKYMIWKSKPQYSNGKVFLTIESQRRMDVLKEYENVQVCETNDKLLIGLDISLTDMSGDMSMSAKLEIRHETPDGTWVDISPYSIDLDKISDKDKLSEQEGKIVKLWSLACELYS
jgi:hypothetical protein